MSRRAVLFSLVIMIIVSALAYLPLINHFGYTHDDWYLMSAAHAEGPKVFWDLFSGDRPLRPLVMIPAYMLFGENPLYYNLSAYIFRVLGALALLWTLRMLWPRQSAATLLMSLLFLIYPGFLSQPNAIDYQSHIVGLAAALFSMVLTVKAVTSEKLAIKILLHVLSVIFGWLYLSQMEWYIAFEFFRWGCVFLLSSRAGGSLLQKSWRAIQWAYPSIAVPAIFLIWRLLFFHGDRGATDVGLQLGQFQLYPLQTVYHWALQVGQDFFDVTLSAWIIPLSQLTYAIQKWSWLLAICAAGIALFIFQKFQASDSVEEPSQPNFKYEALWLGLLITIGGLIPIAMANREVAFPQYSRYSLVSSVGGVILIVDILMQINWSVLRYGLVAVLCLVSVLTHDANGVKYAQETLATNTFWWQVAWRVPQFQKNITLVVSYPAILEEDYFVWGPANLIYYPNNLHESHFQPGLFAMLLNKESVSNIVNQNRMKYVVRRTIPTYPNTHQILLMTQSTVASCVHIIDGSQPEISPAESQSIQQIAPFSHQSHILTDETPRTPPTIIFGPEPPHGWCYYYQEASLARQRGDWDQVLKIGEQAFDKGLTPNDLIEWIPFLQGYAQAGNINRLQELAPTVNADRAIALQACHIIDSMNGLSADVTKTVDSLYCHNNG